MNRLTNYLFNRTKIVITKKGDYAVADFYDCFVFIWIKVWSIKELNNYDYLLKNTIDLWVHHNPKIKVIDKRFEPDNYYDNL